MPNKPGRPPKPKGQKYKIVQVCLPPELTKAIKDIPNKSEFIRTALEWYLKNQGGSK